MFVVVGHRYTVGTAVRMLHTLARLGDRARVGTELYCSE